MVTQEDPKQESVEVLGALAGFMKELVDELVAATRIESESDITLGGGTLVENTEAMAEEVSWKAKNDEGPIGPLLDIASRVDKLTTSHFAMGETVDHLVLFVKLDIIDEQDAVQVAHLNRISASEVGIGLPDRTQECLDTLWNEVMEMLQGVELAATKVELDETIDLLQNEIAKLTLHVTEHSKNVTPPASSAGRELESVDKAARSLDFIKDEVIGCQIDLEELKEKVVRMGIRGAGQGFEVDGRGVTDFAT